MQIEIRKVHDHLSIDKRFLSRLIFTIAEGYREGFFYMLLVHMKFGTNFLNNSLVIYQKP